MKREKEILTEARDLFDHICNNVCPIFKNMDKVDIDDDDWLDKLNLSPMEKEWYDLWEDTYDRLYSFIEKYE